jgi:hypothetical protein
MAVDIWQGWNLCAATIARIFLASILLLSAFTMVFESGFRAELAFSLELLLGAAIATGWLMRYASALVLLGTLAASFLLPHFRIASLPDDPWSTAFVVLASGILTFCGQNTENVDPAPVKENNSLCNEDPRSLHCDPRDKDVKVTIRLEDGSVCIPCRHRCIVTIHDRKGGVRKIGQEAWYARDGL